MKEELLKLTDAYIVAYGLMKEGQRSPRMVKELIDALELFADNRLEGFIVPHSGDMKSVATLRREEFKSRLGKVGHDSVFREFLERLTPYARNRLVERGVGSFKALLSMQRLELQKEARIGLDTLNQYDRALAEDGLYLEMSDAELKVIFG